MTQPPIRRTLLAAGVVLGVSALVTAAMLVDTKESIAILDGTQNRFDIVTMGSADPAWEPAAANWQQGNPEAYRIRLTQDDSPFVVSPGASLDLKIAVKNASPTLGGHLSLRVEDPNDRSAERDPETNNYVDLFPALVFTVAEGGTVLINRVAGPDLQTVGLAGVVAPGEARVLDVTVEVPEGLGNEWQLAATDVQFRFDGENS
ncbi:hypothetical protein [Leucobacter chromiireducens]|uniref:hypothetical protein n=1 Tax=Leucobacter chromiireducens TaxID=283877 RepID=UPI000F6302DE|nr:hypothetical protein [Leucobacter chromiireducens]